MKPQTTLRKCFAAATFTALVLLPVSSSETVLRSSKTQNTISVDVDAAGAKNNPGNFNLIPPTTSTKHQSQQAPADTKKDNHQDEMKKGKTHADEEKHKNHLYHYSRIKRRKKTHTTLVCLALKLFIVISYISVLLCSYISICH